MSLFFRASRETDNLLYKESHFSFVLVGLNLFNYFIHILILCTNNLQRNSNRNDRIVLLWFEKQNCIALISRDFDSFLRH